MIGFHAVGIVIRMARQLLPGFLLCAVCTQLPAAELSAYAVLTTDYVWRGVTQSDGDPAMQLGGDIAFDSGIYAGLWGSTVDIDTGAGRQRDAELDLYLGYILEVSDDWNIGASVIAYTYPGQKGPVDYDYEELQLSANYRDRLWVEYAYSGDLYNTGVDTHNIELHAEWPAGKLFILGGGAGYYDVSELAGDGYAYWELGVTWPVDRFDFDLRYYDTDRWVPIVSSPQRDGARLAFSIRVTF